MKTQKNIVRLVVLIILVSVSGCRLYTDISSTADATTDFNKYHTFAWLPDQTDTTNQPYNNEIIRNNIRNYVGQRFAERGYTVNLDTPDVLLKITIGNKKKEKQIVYSQPYYYGRYYYGSTFYFPYTFDYYYRFPFGGLGGYSPFVYTENQEYMEGSITIDVIDRKQTKLVWSGTAKGDIYDPACINKNIHPAVKAIMKRYPIKEKTRR